MKKFSFILLFITSISYSQNEIERNRIKMASNKEDVEALKTYYTDYFQSQKILIEAYVRENNLSDGQIFSLQRIIDGVPYFYATDNAGSVTTLRANSMYPNGSLGLSVTGQGMVAGVWDGGKVRNTHQEFVGRITLGDSNSSLNGHATHVTGTILAEGVSLSRRGFAYQASGLTHDWTNDANEMISFADLGFLVSNHSYGNIASNLQTYTFGMYNGQSIEVDNIMNAFPYYQVVKSAGNDRNDTSLLQQNIKGGYDLLSGVSTAKNVLTVAAVNQVTNYSSPDDVVMSSFSNFGPTDDGRIKPDISAKGVGVVSTNSTTDSAYTTLQGTSMAAPAITGLILLLQKHYNNLNEFSYMKSASVRGLLCHTAREAGSSPGPDYSFGWGLADGYNAAELISNKDISTIFDELNLSNNATYTRTFTLNSIQDFNVTISWTDPTGSANASTDEDNRTPRLRNNLDLKVIKNGITYYPWRLDPDNPSSPAVNDADNDADNIERVEFFNAEPGTYTIQVSHKGTLQNGSQDFTLIGSSSNGLTLNNSDFIADNSFFLYPVPAKNTLSFTNPNNLNVQEITINDVSGKVVLSNPLVSENSIDISQLQTGIYFVKFTSDGNTSVKKFIKN